MRIDIKHIKSDKEKELIRKTMLELVNDPQDGIQRIKKVLSEGRNTFAVIMQAFIRRGFKKNNDLEFFYGQFEKIVATDGGLKVPSLDTIKQIRANSEREEFNDYIKNVEKELNERYYKNLSFGNINYIVVSLDDIELIKKPESKEEPMRFQLDKELNIELFEELIMLSDDDINEEIYHAVNGNEEIYIICHKQFQQYKDDLDLTKNKSEGEESNLPEFDKLVGEINSTFDDTLKPFAIDLVKHFKKDKGTLKSFISKITKGGTVQDLMDRGIKRKANKAVREVKVKFDNFINDKKVDTSDTNVPVDTSDGLGKYNVPFVSPQIIMIDKENMRQQLNAQMLHIANIVLREEDCEISSFDEYDKDVLNDIFDNMKKRKRYQLAGRAEMLRWHITLYNMRVENIGHKMLSYIIEQCQD